LCGHSDPGDRLRGRERSVEFLLPGWCWRSNGRGGNSQAIDDLVYDRVAGGEIGTTTREAKKRGASGRNTDKTVDREG